MITAMRITVIRTPTATTADTCTRRIRKCCRASVSTGAPHGRQWRRLFGGFIRYRHGQQIRLTLGSSRPHPAAIIVKGAEDGSSWLVEGHNDLHPFSRNKKNILDIRHRCLQEAAIGSDDRHRHLAER